MFRWKISKQNESNTSSFYGMNYPYLPFHFCLICFVILQCHSTLTEAEINVRSQTRIIKTTIINERRFAFWFSMHPPYQPCRIRIIVPGCDTFRITRPTHISNLNYYLFQLLLQFTCTRIVLYVCEWLHVSEWQTRTFRFTANFHTNVPHWGEYFAGLWLTDVWKIKMAKFCKCANACRCQKIRI